MEAVEEWRQHVIMHHIICISNGWSLRKREVGGWRRSLGNAENLVSLGAAESISTLLEKDSDALAYFAQAAFYPRQNGWR